MKGFKVFNSDWTCRGFQFEVGKTFTEDVTPVCCDRGFHFCTKAADCFKYYDFNPDNKVAEVEALGDIDTNNDDSKCSTNKIHIIREITWQEVLDLVNLGTAVIATAVIATAVIGTRLAFQMVVSIQNHQKIFLFNKPSDWTYQDWLNSDARYILMNCPSNVLSWIWEDDMTDEEKEQHPEYLVTGGFLKHIEKETGRQMWWDGLSDRKKDIVMQLPNFDKDIFKEISRNHC